MRPVVILRPEPGATATRKRAEAVGLRTLVFPLFRIEPLRWTAPDPGGFDGLLLTSANALRSAGPELDRLRSLPAFAVGAATAGAARSAGLAVELVGRRGAAELLGALPPALRLLHLCGEDRLEVSARQEITALPVYHSAEIGQPGDPALLSGSVVLVHSPRAGRRLAGLATDKAAIRIAAISPAAAAACGPGWAEVAAADAPNDRELLSLAARLCQHSAPE